MLGTPREARPTAIRPERTTPSLSAGAVRSTRRAAQVDLTGPPLLLFRFGIIRDAPSRVTW